MTEKMIRDLKPGDRVDMVEGGVATIIKVERTGIIDMADDVAYDVTYRYEEGESTMFAVAGKHLVTTFGATQ